jgi:methyl-accepting chemotaxis protein
VTVHQDITEHNSLIERDQQRLEISAAIKLFRETVETNLGAVRDGSAALRSLASELSTSSTEASSQTSGAVCESKAATTSVSLAATAAVELENSISEITERLNQAAAVARSAVAETQATNKEISELAQAVQKIGDIVKFIQVIAEQTNLLALNATIEAARAGDAGKGFTVVASEVKLLAVQTAKATEEIAAQIKSVQGSTDSSVGAIRHITKRIQEIDEFASAIASSIGQQRDATSEITQNVVSAAEGTRVVSSTLEQVAGAIMKTGTSASTVLTTTEAVDNAATNLREKVEDFLRKVAV